MIWILPLISSSLGLVSLPLRFVQKVLSIIIILLLVSLRTLPSTTTVFKYLVSYSSILSYFLFYWYLTPCFFTPKSSKVSRTITSILADHNNSVVWIVSAAPTISNLFIKPLGIVSSAPNIFSIIITYMFHSFFSCLARSK